MRRTQAGRGPVQRLVRVGFLHGQVVDLRGRSNVVRSTVIEDLITRPFSPTHPRAALHLRNARIVGRLNLSNAQVHHPMTISGSVFVDVPDLSMAQVVGLSLVDCDLPGLRAPGLVAQGDLRVRGCRVTGPVDLRAARIDGVLDLGSSQLTGGTAPEHNRSPVLEAGSAHNDLDAVAELHPVALAAERITLAGDLYARDEFSANGGISLTGATVDGNIDLDGATLRSSTGPALLADRLTVGGNLTARHGFTADGEIRLIHARIRGQLNFMEASLRTSNLWALHLGGAEVGSLWLTFAATPQGRVRLSGLHTEAIFDDPRSWPASIDLTGCRYQWLIGRRPTPLGTPSPQVHVTVTDRLSWVDRSPDGYTPQPYEQLAGFYRSSGQEGDARRVLHAKERRRRSTLGRPSRMLGYLLDALVGYGYRTWIAGLWLVAFWAAGTIAFIAQPLTPRDPATAPPRNAADQALDFLLPIVDLGQDNAWTSTSTAQYVIVALILAGWALTTAVIASLTRILNR